MASQNRELNILSIGFNERDTQVMREHFNGDNGISLVGTATGGTEALELFRQLVPDMVAVNIVEEPAVQMNTVQSICAMTHGGCPPFFIAAHLTEETDTRKDAHSAQLSKIGYAFYRYGAEHDIHSIVRFANRMAGAIKTKDERKAAGIHWKCDTATE
ncbi:MAG: hypothetical protein FWD99_03200 [Oscillospiraceae bacterium]|nr:hypothetical protein [Oscillospiraceae bacterium]